MLNFRKAKAKQVGMRLTEEEFSTIKALAQKNKVSVPEMIAAIIREYLTKK